MRTPPLPLLLTLIALTGCGSPAISPATTPAAPPASSASAAGTTAAPAASLAGCPTPQPLSGLPVLARFDTAPDDATADAAGTLWVSSVDADRVYAVAPGGAPRTAFAIAGGPEGIEVLGDGGVVLALQRGDRVVRRAADGTVTTLVQLRNPTTSTGVDGIALDGGDVLVPDPPNGTLLRVPVSGGAPVTVASGLGHVVGVATFPGGEVTVSETEPALHVITGGRVTAIGSFKELDDVVWLGGLLYVTDLAGHALDAVDPATGSARVLVESSPQPQGLTVLGGRLVLVDAAARVAAGVAPCA